MGIYDQLSQLDKTSTVTVPEMAKTAETIKEETSSISPPKPAKKTSTASQKSQGDRKRLDAILKLPLDIQPNRHRIISRSSFEIYQDQLHVLRQISLTAKLSGDQLSISEMVREALDSYLTDKNIV